MRTLDADDIISGAIVGILFAFVAFVYLGFGAIIAALLNLNGLAWYGCIAAWPGVLFLIYIAIYIAFVAIIGVVAIFLGRRA